MVVVTVTTASPQELGRIIHQAVLAAVGADTTLRGHFFTVQTDKMALQGVALLDSSTLRVEARGRVFRR